MNRYDHSFRSMPVHLQASGIHKAGFARNALFEHRSNGFGPEDDSTIVRQFHLRDLNEFWELELSEPLTCVQFAHHLALHFYIIKPEPNADEERIKALGPEAMFAVDGVKAGIRSALRAARSAGEPWFLEAPESQASGNFDPNAWRHWSPGAVVVPPDPPKDGIDLTTLRVRSRAAAEWLLAMPKRRHLVPPSLARYLDPSTSPAMRAPPVDAATNSSGRPTGTGYAGTDEPIALKMIELVGTQKANSLTAAARSLIGRDGSGAVGIGTVESKVERLVKLAKSIRPK